ncbi:MAG: zinc-binding dehydrogenase, partial [Candidatus Puniceispirillaceae bacterium]
VGNDTMAKSLKCARRHGTVVNFGQSSGAYTDFQIKDLAAGSLYLTRPTLFHFATKRDWLESASAEMFARVADGTLKVSINKRAPLDRVAEVHEALAARQTTGCTVLTV